MNETAIEQRLKERFQDDIDSGVDSSDSLVYAIEECPDLILEIIKCNDGDEEEILNLVDILKADVYQKFYEENYDSVSRTIVGDEGGE